MWTVPRDWPSETVFILAAGPSVLNQDLSLLSGRRVIAVKSAWVMYPEADVLFFADGRWWREKDLKPREFGGLIVTSAAEINDPRVLKVKKIPPAALATSPDTVALARTSTTGAINLAVHFGARKIILLGVDGKLAPDGTRHCHGLKWPWQPGGQPQAFADQAQEFRQIAPSAIKMGIEIVNANPDSAIDAFPKISFDEAIA